MKKFVSSLVGVGLSVVLATVQIHASSIRDLQNRQEEIQENIKEAGQILNETQAQRSRVLRETETLDIEMTRLSDEIDVINRELESSTLLLEQTQIDLEDAEEVREQQFETLKERLRFMYIYGDVGYLEIIFDATDFSDFLNRVDYISRIAREDRVKLENFEQTEALIAEKLIQVDNQKTEIETLLSQQERRMQSLEETMQQKEVLLKELLSQEEYYEQQILDWENAETEVQRLIKEAEEAAAKAAALEAERQARARAAAAAASRSVTPSPSTGSTVFYTGGRLAHPVPGAYGVTSPYGTRTSPISGRQEHHTGIDFGARSGTDILAAESGVVIFSGWQGGYGNTVIVDHGGGMTTLYAHASRLLVSVGQQVSRGSVIAKVGSTGFSTGPHLHFEVRVNGRHVDPAPYLR